MERIPSKIPLGAGYVVTTRRLTPKQMKAIHNEDADGIWDSERRCIDILKYLPAGRRWYVYSHEMVHAVNDWQHWLVNRGIAQG